MCLYYFFCYNNKAEGWFDTTEKERAGGSLLFLCHYCGSSRDTFALFLFQRMDNIYSMMTVMVMLMLALIV